MTPRETLFYWMKERYSVFCKKEAGAPKPWTDDPILQKFKFTNVFRQDDRVSRELLKVIKEHMDAGHSDESLFFAGLVFRMFNWPDTYLALEQAGLIKFWVKEDAAKFLKQRKEQGNKIFTGAYVITNNGLKDDKIDLVCDSLDKMHKHLSPLLQHIRNENTLESAVKALTTFPMVGGFIGFQLAGDLMYGPLMPNPTDRFTWAQVGPGSRRGLNRIFGRKLNATPSDSQCTKEIQELLAEYHANPFIQNSPWPVDMHIIQNCLCETDKYLRVQNGEGKPRSLYNGVK